MARLNISIPDELYESAQKWRGLKNLSQICARALQEELEAAEGDRTSQGLFASLRPANEVERALVSRFGLAEAYVLPTPKFPEQLRELLGKRAAEYLDFRICDDARLAIAGGRQMWRVVQNLSPRSVRVSISALGFRENDPQVLHVHPNTLVTLLWLLYSPGAKAQLVAASQFDSQWQLPLPPRDRPSYFVLASCAPFQLDSPFAQLIGTPSALDLQKRGAASDFAYVFFDSDGRLITAPDEHIVSTADCSLPSARLLRGLASRSDARVIAVAGGKDKLPALRAAIENKLCNVVITDSQTAEELLGEISSLEIGGSK